MEIKNEENVNSDYQTKEETSTINVQDTTNKNPKKKSLKKWGLVGATIAVAGIVATSAYYQYYNSQIAGGNMIALETIRIQAYNSRYQVYFGKNRSFSEVNSLVSNVNAHNNNKEELENYGGKIILEGEDIISADVNGTYTADGINATKTGYFTINSFSFDSKTGCINGIKIEYSPTRIED